MPSRRRSLALVTVAFTDIVGSTEVAAELGDRRWRELLSRYHRTAGEVTRRFGGRVVDTAGDGVLARFDDPEGALRAAHAIAGEVQPLGIDVRAGVHVGRVEEIDGKVGGIVVHIGARIAALARPAEILASSTVAELVPGSGFQFEDRGMQALKGVPGRHHVLALGSVDDERLPSPLPIEEAARRRQAIVATAPNRRTRTAVVAAAAAFIVLLGITIVLPDEEPVARSQGPPPNTLVRIDPSTHRVAATIERAPPVERAPSVLPTAPTIAADGGAVWVAAGSVLTHVNVASETVTTIDTSRDPVRMVAAHDAAWSTGFGQAVLLRIDAATLEETHVIGLGPERLAAPFLGTSLDAVWVGLQETLMRIDPISGQITDRHDLGLSIDLIASTPRDLWLVDRLAKTLVRFSTQRGRVRESVDLQSAPDAIAAGDEGDVWLVNREAGTVTPVRAGLPREPVRVGNLPVDIAVGEAEVWVADQEDGSVTVIDRRLGRVEDVIEIGTPVQAVAIDSTSGSVWTYVA